MKINKVLIVFKTHLDIGFTDYSNSVIEKYKKVFIPNAIKTADTLRKNKSSASFCWTTGSWLIYEYLRTASPENRAALEEAIKNGDIRWHGLPFTTHTELMSSELFEYGLSLSARLDSRFGKKTIAAKMTDVPGHTKAIIPFLKNAGIEFLHLGVNPASAVPDVPEIFRWQCDTGESINVIYNGEYGDFTILGDTGVALYFAHTNDNLGGQTPEEVEETFAALREKVPGAELVAADLNDVAYVLREIENTLPVVTDEIGDTWIHGVGSDPKKVAEFRALERVFARLPEGDDKEILGGALMLIPEHTWGLDEKTHLNDKLNFSRSDFEAHRNDYGFKKMECSWLEQRKFYLDIFNSLSDSAKVEYLRALSETTAKYDFSVSGKRVAEFTPIKIGAYTVEFNDKGEIILLSKNGKNLADENHKLLSLMYEQFCYDDYMRFHKRYHRIEDDWAFEDFTKIGMDRVVKSYESFYPQAAVYSDGDSVTVNYSFCEKACKECGAPEVIQIKLTFGESVSITLGMFGKPANRIAEALWVGFCVNDKEPKIRKLGTFIDPKKVVSRGGRNLHATDYGVKYNECEIVSYDSSLVSPGLPHLVDFVNVVPDEKEGVYFNLYNNTWGTNFPMWYDEDTQYRFELKF